MKAILRKYVVRIGLATFVFFSLAPIMYLILLAFLPQSSFISNESVFVELRNGLTLKNFSAAVTHTQFAKRAMISVQMTVLVVAIIAVLGLPAAHAVARLPKIVRERVAFSFLSVRMLPGVAICLPVFWLFNRPGLVPGWLSLGFLHLGFNLPVLIWLSVPIFRSVPVQLEEAALVDGLSRWRILVCVVLPLVSRRLLGVVLIIALLIWNESLFSTIFRVDTVTEVIPSLITHRGVQWGLVMAVGTMVVIPALALLCGVIYCRWGLEEWEH